MIFKFIVEPLKVTFIYIITGGLFWIFLRWFPKLHMNLNRTKAKIENSDFLLIRNIEYNQYYKSKIGTIDSKLVEKCFKITSVTDQLLTFEFIKRKFVVLDYCLGWVQTNGYLYGLDNSCKKYVSRTL